MKECIICKVEKELSDFYSHKEMADGHLNKCKTCCKAQSKEREDKLRLTPEFIETEKARHREKYYRLNYKDLHKPSFEKKKKIMENYKNKYPEKYEAAMAIQYLPKNTGLELHHWSYNNEHFKDVIELSIADHNLLHRNMIYDQQLKLYRNSKGELLDTKQSHVDLLEVSREG